jgi:DNA-binding FrmR family transcriptional regulator
MRSGNRTEGTVDAMIARIEGKVDATLNRIASVEGKVGAVIDRVAAIESKLDAMVKMVQNQQHDTAQDETVHREDQFKLAKLKVRAPALCSRDMR